MSALWKHLKPPSYPHGTTALRILGKLGGRNQHFLLTPPKLVGLIFNFKAEQFFFFKKKKTYFNSPGPENGLNIVTTLSDSKASLRFPLDRSIFLIKQKFSQSIDLEMKKCAFQFLKNCLNGYLLTKPKPGNDITFRYKKQNHFNI